MNTLKTSIKVFRENEERRLNWKDEELKRLPDEDREWLQRSFTMEELEVVIRSFRGDKAPCPDGCIYTSS